MNSPANTIQHTQVHGLATVHFDRNSSLLLTGEARFISTHIHAGRQNGKSQPVKQAQNPKDSHVDNVRSMSKVWGMQVRVLPGGFFMPRIYAVLGRICVVKHIKNASTISFLGEPHEQEKGKTEKQKAHP